MVRVSKHNIDGDCHLTSTAQYDGKKNFVDFPNVAEVNKIPQGHFVMSGIK